MSTVVIKNNTDIINTYYVKYLMKKDTKNQRKNKLENISSKYAKKWKKIDRVWEYDNLIYLQ